MTGFFTFQVRAFDGGSNEAIADAQVVLITTENQIYLTFNNPIDYVTQYDAEVSYYMGNLHNLKIGAIIFDNLVDQGSLRFCL